MLMWGMQVGKQENFQVFGVCINEILNCDFINPIWLLEWGEKKIYLQTHFHFFIGFHSLSTLSNESTFQLHLQIISSTRLKYNQIMNSKNTCAQNLKKTPIQIIQLSSDSEPQLLPKSIEKKGKSFKKIQISKANSYRAIPEVPQIILTRDQMNTDPIELLVKLQKQYEEFGAVKVVTPPQWNPPFSFKYSDKGITTRIQHLHKLRFGKSFKERQQAYNIKSFTNFAKDFEKNYRFRCNPSGDTRQEKEQQQYWDIVNGNYQGPDWKFKTTIEYAADLPVVKHGSGFPLSQNSKTQDQFYNYQTNYFNLNNIYKAPLSLLKIAEEKREFISGVITPWVYMGMMFSTFCWHVEDLWVNSLNYSHQGATKTWYIIPKKDKQKFDQFVQKKTGKKDLLNRITFMLDPIEIMNEGISVYKANQRPGQYVCTFFKAYHAGFSHGFNVGEAVNFISPKSLQYIQDAENYMNENSGKPAVLSYEWLIYSNKNNSYGEFNNLMKSEYEKIIKSEYKYLSKCLKQFKVEEYSQISSSSKYDKNSCSVCRNYQYLSSLKCKGCGKNFCRKDIKLCCDAQYQLIIRSPDEERQRIIQMIAH